MRPSLSAKCAPAKTRPTFWSIAPVTDARARSRRRLTIGSPILSRNLSARFEASAALYYRSRERLIGMVFAELPTDFAAQAHLQGTSLRAEGSFNGASPKGTAIGEDCEVLAGKNRIAGIEWRCRPQSSGDVYPARNQPRGPGFFDQPDRGVTQGGKEDRAATRQAAARLASNSTPPLHSLKCASTSASAKSS
jgi:hypothetical protein